MKNKTWGPLVLFSFVVWGNVAALAETRVDVVQSIPLECDLQVPGVLDTQTVWLDMIQGAKQTLDLEQFYVSDQAGEALAPVLQAIRDAAGRGVQVRLLVDSSYYKTYPDSVNQLGSVANVQTELIDYSVHGGIQHAKYFVVDGQDSFVGSQNFDWRALSHIHEVGLRVTDATIASNLESIFSMDWAEGSAPSGAHAIALVSKTPRSSASPLEVVASPANLLPSGISATSDEVTALMNKAKKNIQIQVMEY